MRAERKLLGCLYLCLAVLAVYASPRALAQTGEGAPPARPEAAAGGVVPGPGPAAPDAPKAAPQGATPRGLVVSQRSNGLPGTEPGETVPQRLLVGAGSIRLDDERGGGRFVIIRLAEEVLREIDPKLQMYTEKPFSDLKRRRIEAEEEREAFRTMVLERLDQARLTEEEVDKALRERGLRRDGQRVLTVRKEQERVGRYRATRHAIAVNDKVYLTVWVTQDIPEFRAPLELYRFYERVGLFPDEVTAVLEGLEGFPVRIVADLDYFSAGRAIGSEVQGVMAWAVEPHLFDTPKGYQRVERFPDLGVVGKQLVCPVCKGVIDQPSLRAPGSRRYVCSRECAVRFARHPERYDTDDDEEAPQDD